jgi:hypothetical protein
MVVVVVVVVVNNETLTDPNPCWYGSIEIKQ